MQLRDKFLFSAIIHALKRGDIWLFINAMDLDKNVSYEVRIADRGPFGYSTLGWQKGSSGVGTTLS